MPARRQDGATATIITEALRIQSAFGSMAGYVFAVRRKVKPEIAEPVLASRHDPGQRPG
jgi:hypothetical protein